LEPSLVRGGMIEWGSECVRLLLWFDSVGFKLLDYRVLECDWLGLMFENWVTCEIGCMWLGYFVFVCECESDLTLFFLTVKFGYMRWNFTLFFLNIYIYCWFSARYPVLNRLIWFGVTSNIKLLQPHLITIAWIELWFSLSSSESIITKIN
jgi:hypothetical protein